MSVYRVATIVTVLVLGVLAVHQHQQLQQQKSLTQFQNLAWSGFLPDSDTAICSIDNGKHWWRGRGPVCYAEDNPNN